MHDAVLAATAKHHGLWFITRDRRAQRAYDAVGVTYELRD